MPPKRALEMLLTGKPISAATGAPLGPGQSRGAAEELEPAVLELVEAIARSSAYTVATGKYAFYSQIDLAEDDAYERCELVMTDNALAHDAQVGHYPVN